ncbi:MAG: hypothetical protein QE277_06840 [Flectobacillus sp.]|nr:hypothetical protein [Flectobacillus sp.]
MKILKEHKSVVLTVTGQGLTPNEKLEISAIIKKEKQERKSKSTVVPV